MLIDQNGVGAGHMIRFRRAAPEKVVRSRRLLQQLHTDVLGPPDRATAGLFTDVKTCERRRSDRCPDPCPFPSGGPC
jgi:hypothetical protein